MTGPRPAAGVAAFLADLDDALHVTRRRRRRILEEVEAHLADRAAALVDEGMTPSAAEAQAVATFGSAKTVAESFSRLDRVLSARRRTLALSAILLLISVVAGWNTYRAADAFVQGRGQAPEMTILLNPAVSSDQVRNLAADLKQVDGAASIDYESAVEAYRNASETVVDHPDARRRVAEVYLPPSLHVDLDDPAAFDAVAAELRGDERVSQIIDERIAAPRLPTLARGALSATFVATALYLLATFVAASTRKVSGYGA